MKNLFLTAVICLASLFGYSQSTNWKVIGAPDSTYVSILYYSSHGYVIGNRSDTYQFVISKDEGNTWQEFQMKGYFSDFNAYKLFTEDKNGNIYFAYDDFIYKLDPNLLSTTKFIDLKDIFRVDHLVIMDNGNMIIADYYSLWLYNNVGQMLKKHDWQSSMHSIDILPGTGNQKNYVAMI